MDIVVCCHLDATGVSTLELKTALMLLAVLGFCEDIAPSVLMHNCMLVGEELSAWSWVQFISKILLCVFQGGIPGSMAQN